jgi:hypothetical protein
MIEAAPTDGKFQYRMAATSRPSRGWSEITGTALGPALAPTARQIAENQAITCTPDLTMRGSPMTKPGPMPSPAPSRDGTRLQELKSHGLKSRRLALGAACAGAALLVVTAALGAGALSQEPPDSDFRLGQRVRIDDGTCPAGQIKEVTASKLTPEGIVRTRACVKR